MGINVKHLLDRPCSVCEFHKENGCCKWFCVFEQEPTTAEWTEKLTKASEDAYNKGYADGMKDQEIILDKIRAEILEAHEDAYAREDYDTAYGLSMALDILDKYKAESERT